MAVDDHLPVHVPLSATSTSASSSSPITKRRQLVQVATNNSSTFIQFPTNSRQLSLFIPTYRSRTNHSKTRPFAYKADIQSISNTSKPSNTPSSSIGSTDCQANRSEQRFNPILSNSLLNHRKEQPKSFPIKSSIDCSHTTRLCLSSRPLKTISDDQQISTIRAHTAPLLAHQIESSISDRQTIPNDNNENNDEEEVYHLDKSKYDYITRWLNEVKQATCSTQTIPKRKRPKTRFVQT